jgi:hypothetical protein
VRELSINSRDGTFRFQCPVCRAGSICDICYMGIAAIGIQYATQTYMLICRACGQGSVWKQFDRQDNFRYKLRLVDPIVPDAPAPFKDMPADVAKDYEEARLVSSYSPRAASALLRLSLQKLCVHLGEPGKNIDTDIRALARKPEFGERLIRAADTLRITGNNALHPGEMDEADIGKSCKGLFDLVNLIVHAGITQPKAWDAMYEALPEGARQAAEKKDGRNGHT